jgi:hypothetical protein
MQERERPTEVGDYSAPRVFCLAVEEDAFYNHLSGLVRIDKTAGGAELRHGARGHRGAVGSGPGILAPCASGAGIANWPLESRGRSARISLGPPLASNCVAFGSELTAAGCVVREGAGGTESPWSSSAPIIGALGHLRRSPCFGGTVCCRGRGGKDISTRPQHTTI